MPMRFIYPALFAAGVLFTPSGAYAIEFKSVADEITVLYDAPTTQSTKRLILTRGYPVEVIIASDGWVRVRDEGGIGPSKRRMPIAEVAAKGDTGGDFRCHGQGSIYQCRGGLPLHEAGVGEEVLDAGKAGDVV